MLGTVKWYSEDKGYGFIAMDGGDDVFVHVSALKIAGLDSLREQDRVTFEVGKNPRSGKTCAEKIQRIG